MFIQSLDILSIHHSIQWSTVSNALEFMSLHWVRNVMVVCIYVLTDQNYASEKCDLSFSTTDRQTDTHTHAQTKKNKYRATTLLTVPAVHSISTFFLFFVTTFWPRVSSNSFMSVWFWKHGRPVQRKKNKEKQSTSTVNAFVFSLFFFFFSSPEETTKWRSGDGLPLYTKQPLWWSLMNTTKAKEVIMDFNTAPNSSSVVKSWKGRTPSISLVLA